MKTILIISSSLDEEKKIQDAKLFKSDPDLNFVTSASFGQEANWWLENMPAVLIVCLPEDEAFHPYFLKKLTDDVPKNIPLVLSTPTLSPPIIHAGVHFDKFKILRTPFNGEEVYAAIHDYIHPRELGKQQAHQRYMVNQTALVEIGEQVFSMVIRNLSLSGAFVEYEGNDAPVAPNDRITLKVQTGDAKKDYEFIARVVWARSLLASGSGLCMGVTFIGTDPGTAQLGE